MNDHPHERRPDPARYRWLEQLTGCVLAAVMLSLGWMLLAAYLPEGLRLSSETAELIVVLTLLTAALVLVSVVALLHTRSSK